MTRGKKENGGIDAAIVYNTKNISSYRQVIKHLKEHIFINSLQVYLMNDDGTAIRKDVSYYCLRFGEVLSHAVRTKYHGCNHNEVSAYGSFSLYSGEKHDFAVTKKGDKLHIIDFSFSHKYIIAERKRPYSFILHSPDDVNTYPDFASVLTEIIQK